ncbi:hypothetical protein EYF80_023829 [Liparis tanakae]|uniref:Uncharacterized protein n=1 Tax=Liparis tanakae TaxID=230148 RepID=A0A4Z2HJL7_9TELE|nr:hypothetical protein EYF80_023829 [Liparis tanakae]
MTQLQGQIGFEEEKEKENKAVLGLGFSDSAGSGEPGGSVGGLGAVSTSGSGSRGMEPPENNENRRGQQCISRARCSRRNGEKRSGAGLKAGGTSSPTQSQPYKGRASPQEHRHNAPALPPAGVTYFISRGGKRNSKCMQVVILVILLFYTYYLPPRLNIGRNAMWEEVLGSESTTDTGGGGSLMNCLGKKDVSIKYSVNYTKYVDEPQELGASSNNFGETLCDAECETAWLSHVGPVKISEWPYL